MKLTPDNGVPTMTRPEATRGVARPLHGKVRTGLIVMPLRESSMTVLIWSNG